MKNKQNKKISIIVASIIVFILLVLSFIVPVRKSDCGSPCKDSSPYTVCPDVCWYEHYNLWGMVISEGTN